MPHRLRSVIYGAAAGAMLALVGLAVYGSRASLGSIEGILLDQTTGRGRSDFVISSGGLYLAIVILALLGGMLIAGLVYAFGRENEPEGTRFPLRYLLPTAGITAAIMAYAMLRGGLGAAANIDSGIVTISVFRLIVVTALTGLVAGGATASVVDALARPGFLGIEGEAVPTSSTAFMKEMITAMGTPTVAVIAIAVFAVSLSQVLLSLHGAAAVAAFSVVAAIVLALAALAAYRPWDDSSST
ncbi:MAG: hypothetical protein HKN91_10285 [Acidimicrobiia bacterium]|nr:hypothetical protein [Acidimicrobiia bacterium]